MRKGTAAIKATIKHFKNFNSWLFSVRKRRLFIKKLWRSPSLLIFFGATAILLSMLSTSNNPKVVNYTGLLNVVAQGESNGNYNAYFGNASNTSVDFTSMTVNEVLAWQRDYVKKGSPSSAVGKYQFVRPTLEGLVKEMSIDKEAHFSAELQDRLAIKLLERRGLNDYMKGKLTREQFAHNLSKEWAALPQIVGKDPNASYYAGDGLNKVRVSTADIYGGIAALHHEH